MRPGPLLAAALGTLTIGVLSGGCGSDDEPASTPTAPPSEVAALDFAFEPDATEIEAGETVTWTNEGATIHNVKGEGFFSEAIDPGESYEHAFEKPGSYEYLCNLHPEQMRGVVEVKG